jgi:hypothetical protein
MTGRWVFNPYICEPIMARIRSLDVSLSGQAQQRCDYIFENEWQSFRTKKDRSLELTSVAHECPTGLRKVAVKVVDIFGNDTMTIVEVTIGGKK